MNNQPLRCAIIEDEPLAQELLERYIRRVASLQLVATIDDAVEAFEQLPALRPDLLFLDINMPEMTGIEFLRAYPAPHPIVVMTTANPNHALDGFELGIADYLLKPITFERFMKAIGRVKERSQLLLVNVSDDVRSLPASRSEPVSNFLYLKTDGRLEQIWHDDIVFAEALGDYIKVFLPGRYIVTHLTMTKLAENLPGDRFLRINRSYIVQLRHIKTLDGNTISTSTGHDLTVGPNYRDMVKERIRAWLVA